MKRKERERKRKAKEARKKLEMNPPKKKSPNFGLCACVKAKYCTILQQKLTQNLAKV